MRRRGGAQHKIGDDKVARLSDLHDFFFPLFSFVSFHVLGFNMLGQYGFLQSEFFFRDWELLDGEF